MKITSRQAMEGMVIQIKKQPAIVVGVIQKEVHAKKIRNQEIVRIKHGDPVVLTPQLLTSATKYEYRAESGYYEHYSGLKIRTCEEGWLLLNMTGRKRTFRYIHELQLLHFALSEQYLQINEQVLI